MEHNYDPVHSMHRRVMWSVVSVYTITHLVSCWSKMSRKVLMLLSFFSMNVAIDCQFTPGWVPVPSFVHAHGGSCGPWNIVYNYYGKPHLITIQKDSSFMTKLRLDSACRAECQQLQAVSLHMQYSESACSACTGHGTCTLVYQKERLCYQHDANIDTSTTSYFTTTLWQQPDQCTNHIDHRTC